MTTHRTKHMPAYSVICCRTCACPHTHAHGLLNSKTYSIWIICYAFWEQKDRSFLNALYFSCMHGHYEFDSLNVPIEWMNEWVVWGPVASCWINSNCIGAWKGYDPLPLFLSTTIFFYNWVELIFGGLETYWHQIKLIEYWV
jgi:hypothetical protein